MLNIVLFGPPGAGKGTQSQKLIDKYGLVHLSTGDLLRNEIANGTGLGMQAKAIMDRGDLVNDEIVIGMIESKLDANPHAKGFIFDGFPRTQAQAIALDDLLQKKGTAISAMLALEVDNEELIKRLLLRGKETGRPDDQDETIISNRVNEYNTKTLPLKQYYSEQSKFHSIKGTGTVESIFDELVERITFVNAEIELTMLENDIEHLDLTVNDFEEATEISPELQKDMDEVRTEHAVTGKEEDKSGEGSEEKKGLFETIKEKVISIFHTDKKDDAADNEFAAENVKVPAKKAATAKPAKKATAPAKKAAAKAPAKAAAKKAVAPAKKAAAPAKKASVKTATKAAPKKAVKKAAKKAVAKAPVKKAVKKVTKKVAPVKAAKKAVKKTVKKAAAKAPVKKVVKTAKKVAKKITPVKAVAKKAVKKVVKKVAAKAPVKKVVKAAKKAVKKVAKKVAPVKAAAKKAVKKVVKKTAAKAPVKKVVKAAKKVAKKVMPAKKAAPKKAAKKKK